MARGAEAGPRPRPAEPRRSPSSARSRRRRGASRAGEPGRGAGPARLRRPPGRPRRRPGSRSVPPRSGPARSGRADSLCARRGRSARRAGPPRRGGARGRRGSPARWPRRRAGARAARRVAGAAAAERDAGRAGARREAELLEVRAVRVRELAAELDRLTDEVHRDEVARAEQRLRLEQLETRAAEEYGVDAATRWSPSTARTGPVPPTAAEVAERRRGGRASRAPEPVPYDRAVQEQRAATAERDLALLGKVNPLALEEFAALEERHAFLATQLEDLKTTRRDLLTVVKEVDERIQQVFAAAFADTAREFEQVFARLFPGGEGRLVLTEPDDLLATGIEVEARPPGKKVKRLSLLSGGERSLTAVALAGGDLPGPAVAVLRAGRGRGRAGRHQPAAGCCRPVEELRDDLAADHHHPPEADDGDRRRAVRGEHARRRRVPGREPAPAGARAALRACPERSRASARLGPLWNT